MSIIKVSNLTFSYPGSYDNIFDNVSFSIDTNWKLGFIGRNGRGKTTFLNLLMNKYEYSGNIAKQVEFDYFPFEVKDKEKNSYDIANEIKLGFKDNCENWKLDREINLLEMDAKILSRPFITLSKGEQTKVSLAILFIKDNNFLLIDEPTNHLDEESRDVVANYLNSKKGFVLVSHDRKFLDSCVNYILSINKNNIEIQKGNFSSWIENKNRQDNYELAENERLKKDINRLERSASIARDFSIKAENKKRRDLTQSDNRVDTGFIGKKSAKMMKRSISSLKRKESAVEEKSQLLKNIEEVESLKINPLNFKGNRLIEAENLSIYYDDNIIFEDISFIVEKGDRLQIKGKNGTGKSSLIRLILGQDIPYKGEIRIPNSLKISYVSQDTTYLNGNLTNYSIENNIDDSLFKTILRKLGFERIQFEKNIEDYSEGQKKKVLIAKSLAERADIYIWDEPLNYIDLLSRIQIEELILNYSPTMIFVEHDEAFSKIIATKIIELKK